MYQKSKYISISIYLLAVVFLFAATAGTNRAMTALAEGAALADRTCLIIDAGHGGVDGGATSCTGVLESNINLEIARRLNDLCHLFGYKTRMIRTEDCSIYTKGETIAAKKVSDLKERVRIVNSTENSVLISIHQNYFPQEQYYGAQTFYASTDSSRELAELLQKNTVATLNPGSRRQAKAGKGIYLLEHIQRPGILIECGFLSNPGEEEKLRAPDYQKKLCCCIAASVSHFLTGAS